MRARGRARQKKWIYIARGGVLISGAGLINSLKRTTAATAITSGMTHLVQD